VPKESLKNLESHFAFGKNWAEYASLIGDAQIEEATKGLIKLVPENEFKGRSFLDIGCGSGLHALGAAQLGVSRVFAIDPRSRQRDHHTCFVFEQKHRSTLASRYHERLRP